MINKKAFEIQFNWIFVLIAGAAILIFFTAIITEQKDISEKSLRTTVIKNIDAIIAGAGVSTGATSIETIQNSNIEVSCNRISIEGISKSYQNLILFAPSLVKGDKFVWQSKDFSVPYRATNLLYVTSDQMRYTIIWDTNLAQGINKSLSLHLNKEFYKSMPTIKNSNNYKVRFVTFEAMINFPKSLEKMPDSDVTAIKVSGNNEKGTLEFYQKSKSTWILKGRSYYITEASLIGAIFSDTIENYECNMLNVFSRLKLVTDVYSERTKKLKSATEAECEQAYDNALVQLSSIGAASLKFDQQSVDNIANAAKLLSDENKELQKNSCPLVY